MLTHHTMFFEDAVRRWEQIANNYISSLKSNIKSLSNSEFRYEKARVRVCEKEPDGRKKRCGQGPYYGTKIGISKEDAETAWKLFEQIVVELGLPPAERLSNNEEGLERYDFRANDTETYDRFSCKIWLLGEWNSEGHISVSVFVGPRFRAIDNDKE